MKTEPPHLRPLYHSRGLKTSAIGLASFLSLRGNEIVGLEPEPGTGKFFVILAPRTEIDQDLRDWEQNAPVHALDFAAEIAALYRRFAEERAKGRAR